MRALPFLAFLALLSLVLSGCSKPTYAELQQKVQALSNPGPGSRDVVAKVKELLGAPYKEQAIGETYYLYYRVQEGRAQVVVVGWLPAEGSHGVYVENVNLL